MCASRSLGRKLGSEPTPTHGAAADDIAAVLDRLKVPWSKSR